MLRSLVHSRVQLASPLARRQVAVLVFVFGHPDYPFLESLEVVGVDLANLERWMQMRMIVLEFAGVAEVL